MQGRKPIAIATHSQQQRAYGAPWAIAANLNAGNLIYGGAMARRFQSAPIQSQGHRVPDNAPRHKVAACAAQCANRQGVPIFGAQALTPAPRRYNQGQGQP